jgi:uncharacterized protein
MRILIAGATGFIGKALCRRLEKKHELIILSRSITEAKKIASDNKCIDWETFSKEADENLPTVDAIINLCGARVSNGKWTAKRKKIMRDSRIETTRTLVKYCQKTHCRATFINASGIGIYPGVKDIKEGGDQFYCENDPFDIDKNDFLAQLAHDWERVTDDLEQRVVLLRFGVVCDRSGGVLESLYPVFSGYMGGRIGSGRQPFPWVSLTDVVNIIEFAVENEKLEGPVNVISPQDITQKEFAKAFAKSIGKPSFFPFPAWLVKTMFGEMGRTLLLQGQKAQPKKLLDLGYEFEAPNIKEAVKIDFDKE